MGKDQNKKNWDKIIWKSREEDYNSIPNIIWFSIYYVVYPLSVWFANKGIKPNNITLLMFPSALLASVLFFTGNIYCVIIGAFVIQLFQIFDFADGKVARATNQKSKYGKELDYLMHVICHPIVYLSFIGLLKMNNYSDYHYILLLVLFGAVVESVIRSLKNIIDAMDSKNTDSSHLTAHSRHSIVHYADMFYNGIISFPYFMCVLPFISILEYFININHSLSLTVICIIVQILYNSIYMVRMIVSVLRRCLNS